MGTKADGTSVEEISGWIQKAASAESRQLAAGSVSAPASDRRSLQIDAALARAQKKTFIRTIKPLRRLIRDQGAVNDSLIEAVYHLNAQNKELLEQVENLGAVVSRLRRQLRRLRTDATGGASAPHREPTGSAPPERAD
jgi:hypothetical protein